MAIEQDIMIVGRKVPESNSITFTNTDSKYQYVRPLNVSPLFISALLAHKYQTCQTYSERIYCFFHDLFHTYLY